MSRIPMLPRWVLPNRMPSVYEMESATAIEMTAKLYGAVDEFVKNYNAFADEFEKAFNEATQAQSTEISNFKEYVSQRLCLQNEKLEASINKINLELKKLNMDIAAAASQVINQAIQDGKITVAVNYNPETEEVEILTGGEV